MEKIPKLKDLWMLYKGAHVWTLVEKSVPFDGYMYMRCFKNPPAFLALNKLVLRPLKDVTFKEMGEIHSFLCPPQDYYIRLERITEGYWDNGISIPSPKVVGEFMCEVEGEESLHSLVILNPKDPDLPFEYYYYDPIKRRFKDQPIFGAPSLTLYMISRYFDLWGHIDRLEAMDSTFLTPDPYLPLKS